MVAAWDQLIPPVFGKLNRNGVPYVMLIIVLIPGIVPLILDWEISAIARAVGIITSFPTILILWSVMYIPKKFPEAYDEALFKLNIFWRWFFFVFSMISVLIGLVILSQDMTPLVLWTIAIGIALSIVYYPIRRAYMKSADIDLDQKTTDRAIFDH